MPLIPDSVFGITYALMCFLVLCVSRFTMSDHAKAVALIMAGHWVALRGIWYIDHQNAALWVAHDAAVIGALCAYGSMKQSILAFAGAAVFFVVMLFDQWWWLFGGSFEAAAAVAEAGGYLVFIMTLGAAFGSDNDDGWGADFRRFHRVGSMAGGRAISRHANVHGESISTNTAHQEKDCTVA